jgi:hypothetical protein
MKPLLLMAASTASLFLLRSLLPGTLNFWQLAAIGILFAAIYGVVAYFTVLTPYHQSWVRGKLTALRQRFA